MDRKEFAQQYRENVEPIDMRKYQQQRERQASQSKKMDKSAPIRYRAKKGTMSKAKSKKRKPNTKLAALILSAIIGTGTIALINYHNANQPEPTNMIEMQQDGINSQSLGLNAETVELFEKYDEYFENFDEDNQYYLTDDQVITMIDEVKSLHFSTVKEKMGSLIGEEPKNIRMYYSFDNADGQAHTTIVINEDSYNREIYSNISNWPLPDKNSISPELSNVILQIQDLESLTSDIKTDKITKVNAVKKLEKLYKSLEEVATSDFIKDEKGNISIVHYEDKQMTQEDDRERD